MINEEYYDKLSAKEKFRFNIVKNVFGRTMSRSRAKRLLGIKDGKLDCYLQQFVEDGPKGFAVEIRRWELPPEEIAIHNQIIECYKGQYKGMSAVQFSQMLYEHENIEKSPREITKILNMHYLYTPQQIRGPKKEEYRADLEVKLQQTTDNMLKEEIEYGISLFASSTFPGMWNAIGQEIQFDASSFLFNEREKWTLHLAVDAFSGLIVGAWFDWEETTYAYLHTMHQMLEKYGVPDRIVADNRKVFRYSHDDETQEQYTTFSWICKCTGIDLKTYSDPRRKGAVEKKNQDMQRALVGEFRVNNITDIVQANDFMINYYIPKYNATRNADGKKNVFDPIDSGSIDFLCAFYDTRKGTPSHTIIIDKGTYLLVDKNGDRFALPTSKKALIITTLSGERFAMYKGLSFIVVDTLDYTNHNEIKAKYKVIPENYMWDSAVYDRYIKTIAERRKRKQKNNK